MLRRIMNQFRTRTGMALICLANLIFFSFPVNSQEIEIDYIHYDDFESFMQGRTQAEKSRFLVQATFGPSLQEIFGFDGDYEGWIDDQLALPPTYLYDDYFNAKLDQTSEDVILARRINPVKVAIWNRTVSTAPDQLRQRMAFALSQILVISDKNLMLETNADHSAIYHDLLVEHAFGNYRDLLEAVTRNPAMGIYLSHLKNRKKELINPDSGTYISPDENYAREIMQLFSIGIFERNDDYSLVDGDPDMPGLQAVEAYDENMITNLARVFSGLSYQCTDDFNFEYQGETYTIRGQDCRPGPGRVCEGVACHFSTNGFFSTPRKAPNRLHFFHPDSYSPMICYPRFHDTGRDDADEPLPSRPAQGPYTDEPYRDKRVIGHIPEQGQAPLPMKPIGCNSLNDIPNPNPEQRAAMQACVDYCDDEIDMALDGLFNHPNVPSFISNQLIQRFITSNPSPEYIYDISQVFKDNGYGVRGDLGAVIKAILLHPDARSNLFRSDASFGKVKEPLLKLTHSYRALDIQSASDDPHDFGVFDVSTLDEEFGQRAYAADSVFNFYSPDYQHPGEPQNMGLNSPELQIYTDLTLVSSQNAWLSFLCNGWGFPRANNNRSDNCRSNGQGEFGFTLPVNGRENSYIAPSWLDALPGFSNYEALVDQLNWLFLSGRMSTGLDDILRTHIRDGMPDSSERQKKLVMINLIINSPEFAVQR